MVLPFQNQKRFTHRIEKEMDIPQFFDYLDTISAVAVIKSSQKGNILSDLRSNLTKKLHVSNKNKFKVVWPIFLLLGKK